MAVASAANSANAGTPIMMCGHSLLFVAGARMRRFHAP